MLRLVAVSLNFVGRAKASRELEMKLIVSITSLGLRPNRMTQL